MQNILLKSGNPCQFQNIILSIIHVLEYRSPVRCSPGIHYLVHHEHVLLVHCWRHIYCTVSNLDITANALLFKRCYYSGRNKIINNLSK